MSSRCHSVTVWGVAALAILAVASVSPLAADPFLDFLAAEPQVLPETVGTPRDAGDFALEMKALQQRLSAERVALASKRPLVVQLTAAERRLIDDVGRVERKYLVGVSREVGAVVDFATAQGLGKGIAALGVGAARGARNGGFVWTAAVKVPGATAVRLHLSGVDLPAGAELYVFNLDGQAFGPYKGRGPLGTGEIWTHTVFGPEIQLQLHAAGGLDRAPRLTLAEVGAMGARFLVPRYSPQGGFDVDAMAKAFCADNASCVVNAACQSSPAVNDAKDAVASILFQSGASFFICTGGLIADTVTTSVIPYFLTANHCISSSGEASSVETYFDYVTTCSNPNCTEPYSNPGETIGSTIKSNGSASDWSLLQLSSAPTTPDGVATYLGWNSSAVANTNNLALYRISHPKGSPQAYTEGVVDTNKPTCGTLPRGRFIYSRDTLGATEGGSSGSPVVDSLGRVVGQLYGACGFNLNDVCDAASNATVDGAFASYFSNVAPFLSPGGGGCSPKGASCTTSSQCCSNKCSGKPGSMTCK